MARRAEAERVDAHQQREEQDDGVDADQRAPRLPRRQAATDRAAAGAHRAHQRDRGALRPRGAGLGHDRPEVVQRVVGLRQHAVERDERLRHAGRAQRRARPAARVAQGDEVALERGADLALQLRALFQHGLGGQRGA